MKRVVVNLIVGLLVGSCIAGATLLVLLALEALGIWIPVLLLVFVGLWSLHNFGEVLVNNFKKDGG